MLSILGCLTPDHDPKLVALAGFICIIACLTTVNLLSRAQLASGNRKMAWFGAAAFIFGSGVWSLHFVAMLAFMPGFPIAYDPLHTARSLIVAIFGTYAAFALREYFERRPASNILSGIVLGAAIAGMHYDGVAAMRVPGQIALEPAQVWLSVFFGIDFSMIAFVRATDLSSLRRRVEVATYIGVGVVGMHFVGMSALTMIPGAIAVQSGAVLGSASLAVAVGSISVAIIVGGMVGAFTDQHLANQSKREALRLRQLADASFEGIIIHRDNVIVNANRAFAKMVGRDIKDLIGHSAMEFVAEKDYPRILKRVTDHPEGGRLEFEAETGDGRFVPVEVLSRPIEFGGGMVYVSAVRDLSERKRAEERIQFLAHHDALTGLCNRLLLSERLTHMIALAGREENKVAVLYVDLDRFKPVNDLLGHEGGDALLVEVAQRLQHVLRPSDTIARVGGDEFVVVQALGKNIALAKTSAERIIEELSAPFFVSGQKMTIGASVGIATYPSDGKTATELLRNADKAMYHAKHEARGTVSLFAPGIEHRLKRLRVMEQDLRHAIERNEMELYYQAIFDKKSAICGLEAVLRWNHPIRGVVSPADFIPVAEECGLICELGNWVLETACTAAKAWPPHWRVAVNVSPVQFGRSDYLDKVVGTLKRTGLAPDRLELEVTENLLIGDTARVLPILTALRQHGVHISLDDFGTGYSSLNYLHRFPFEKIKIDRSFIAGLGQNEEAEMIVRAIIALGHSLRMTVTAEGLENQTQLAILRRLNCDMFQGYLVGRPITKAQVDETLVPLVIKAVGQNIRPIRLLMRSAEDSVGASAEMASV